MTVVGAVCGYLLLASAGMQPPDSALLVAADAALVLVVSEIVRERA
ncbi:MAG TPA: hypothetical protein VHC69_34120 [Polyangiaceae bacterium]|nr:hypothetical protein [Polyangiaceae bacterium]